MNHGAELLLRVIERRGATQREIAEECQIDPGKLSRLLSGKALPNRREAVRLLSLGIDPRAWDEPAHDGGEAA